MAELNIDEIELCLYNLKLTTFNFAVLSGAHKSCSSLGRRFIYDKMRNIIATFSNEIRILSEKQENPRKTQGKPISPIVSNVLQRCLFVLKTTLRILSLNTAPAALRIHCSNLPTCIILNISPIVHITLYKDTI